MSESFKYFKVTVEMPDKSSQVKFVNARTKWEAVELLMYRHSFSSLQPDRSKYKTQGKILLSTQKKIEQK